MNRDTQLQKFRDACASGNLMLAKELTKTYDVTVDDVRLYKNLALRQTCGYGHTFTAQWLVKTFNLTTEDVRCVNNFALRYVCTNGHTSAAQWLLDTFYTVEDALEMSELESTSPKMKDWLLNYQPFGASVKPVTM